MPLDIIIYDRNGVREKHIPLYLEEYDAIWDKITQVENLTLLKRVLHDFYGEEEVYLNELEGFQVETIRLKELFESTTLTTIIEFIENLEGLISYAIAQRLTIKLIGD